MYLDASFIDELDDPARNGDAGNEETHQPRIVESVPLRRPTLASGPQRTGVRLGQPVAQPLQAGSRKALHRRRRVFFGLLGLIVASLTAAVILRSPNGWGLHAASVALFLAYVMMLVLHHHRALERGSKVHFIGGAERRRSGIELDDTPIRRPRPAVVVLRSGTAR